MPTYKTLAVHPAPSMSRRRLDFHEGFLVATNAASLFTSSSPAQHANAGGQSARATLSLKPSIFLDESAAAGQNGSR